MSYVLSRFINGICLNPKEYIVDQNNEAMTFKNKQLALDYFNETEGCDIQDEEQLEDEFGVYIDEEEAL